MHINQGIKYIHLSLYMYTLTCTYVLIGPLTFETSGLIVFHIEFC